MKQVQLPTEPTLSDEANQAPGPNQPHYLKRSLGVLVMTTAALISAGLSASRQGQGTTEGKAKAAEVANENLSEEERLDAIIRSRINWRRVGDIQNEGHHCLDGRCKCQKGQEIVGGAGGGAGDIAAAVVALKDLGYDLAKGNAMEKVIDAYAFTIYRHTDTHAINALEKAIQNDPILKISVKTHEDVERLLERGTPNLAAKNRLLALLNEQAVGENGVARLKYDGCGHEAFLGANPQAYGMTPELFRLYNEALYVELWEEGDHEILDPLEGEHKEQFATAITFEGEINGPDFLIPAISPADSNGGNQIFAFHPQYTQYCLEQYAKSLKISFPDLDSEKFVAEALKVAEAHFKETSHRLAKGKTVLEVHFTTPDQWKITRQGVIE